MADGRWPWTHDHQPSAISHQPSAMTYSLPRMSSSSHSTERLRGSLSTVEYFTFGFGTMIGVGWVVLMDDWLSRGGPGLIVGLLLTVLIVVVNYRGIKPSGVFQDVMTFGLLATFAIFTALGFARGSSANWQPLFSHGGGGGVWLSIFLVLQIVPYYM